MADTVEEVHELERLQRLGQGGSDGPQSQAKKSVKYLDSYYQLNSGAGDGQPVFESGGNQVVEKYLSQMHLISDPENQVRVRREVDRLG